MRPTPCTPNQRLRRALLALAIALALPALAHAQNLTTALYPDDATRRAVCEDAMAHGEETAERYRAIIDDELDRTLYAYEIIVHTPLRLLAIGCANNARFGWGYTVDELLSSDTYVADHVSVLIFHARLPEAFFMVNNHARMVALDPAGREVARVEPDPMESDLIGAETRRTLDPDSGLLLWSGYSVFALPLHDETLRRAILDGATLRIEWRAPGPLYSERGAWEWRADAFGR